MMEFSEFRKIAERIWAHPSNGLAVTNTGKRVFLYRVDDNTGFAKVRYEGQSFLKKIHITKLSPSK